MLPYLQKLGFNVSDLTEDANLLSVPNNKYTEAYYGNLLELRNYTFPSVSDEIIKKWQALPTFEALSKCPEILNIPFSGSAYEMDDIATYHDFQHGVLSHPANHLGNVHYPDEYERGLKLHRIEEFEPVLFASKEKSIEEVSLPFDSLWF